MKPPWAAQNKREKDAMRDWIFYQIEETYRKHRDDTLSGRTNKESVWILIEDVEDAAVEDAYRGDLTKLRELFDPKFHPFLHPPRKRGRRPYASRPSRSEHYDDSAKLLMARKLVPIIRAIWRKHYGKWRRHPEYGYDAYEIAAAYFNIKDVEAVAAKPSGKRKKKQK